MRSIYKKAVSNLKADVRLIEKTKQKMKESEQSPNHLTPFQKRRIFRVSGLAAAVLLLLVMLIPIFQKTNETKVEKNIAALQIEAADQKDGTISLNTEFIIQTKNTGLTEKELRKYIQITPEIAFELKKKSSNQYILTLKESLQADEIINVTLTNEMGEAERKWAFQTENILQVTQTIPAHEETYVPVQTGIEITLSTPSVSLEHFKKMVSISPKLNGEWKKNRNVFTFVPASSLKPKTVYQVELAKGLETEEGQKFQEGYTFVFETNAAESDSVYTLFENGNKITETFLLEDPKVISVTASDSLKSKDVLFDVEIFQYGNADAYKQDLLAYSQQLNTPAGRFSIPNVSKEKLTKAGKLKTPLQFETESEYIPAYIVLPEDMGEGLYYIEVTGKNPDNGQALLLRKWIQVSDVSVYQMKVAHESLFWIHDAKTGKTLENAKVTLQSDLFQVSGETNTKGVLQLDLEKEDKVLQQYGVVDIQAGKQRFIDLFQVGEANYHHDSANYFSYLYTDRAVYLSSDTIEVWGMIQPRNKKEEIPNSCFLVLGEEGSIAAKTEVKVNQNGMFSGQISFENLGVNHYETIQLQDEAGRVYGDTSISILNYVKPVYQLTVKDKQPVTVYPTENEIKADVQMNFYDGTAASHMKLEARYYEENQMTTVPFQTDENGAAQLAFRIKEDKNTWRPQWFTYDLQTTDAENTPLLKVIRTCVIYRDVSLQGSYNKNKNAIEIESHQIDVSKVKDFENMSDEQLLGTAYNGKVTAEIHKTYSVKNAIGTYYDFIQKKNVTKYEYVRKDEIIQTKSVSLQNGKGMLKDVPNGGENASYYVTLQIQDTNGKLVEENIWYDVSFFQPFSNQKAYYFNKENTNNDADAYAFSDHEDVSFLIQENGKNITEGQILASVVQDGISEVFMEDTPNVIVPFTEDRVPNYVLTGAYFDGKHIYPIADQYMHFDPAERAVKVEIQSSQEQYAPGDKAEVEVKVTDIHTGEPIPNAEISLSVVDEAVFDVMEQTVNPLESLYRWAFSPSIQVETSYIEHNLLDEGGAEMGSGDGEAGIRNDFEDTAAFLTGQTNASGMIRFTVPFPDNLTSWRLTAQAITPELYAGYAQENVPVTKDFFVRSIQLDTFIAGDDIHIPLRTEGRKMTGKESVQYTVTIEGKGIAKKVMKAKGTAGKWTHMKVGNLPEGGYTVGIQAKAENDEDRVETTFNVVNDSIISSYQLQTVDLVKKNIEPARYPFTLEISRATDEMYRNILQYFNMQQGNRSDERMARAYAEQKLTKNEFESPTVETFADVVTAQGGISLLPYSDVDLALTAKAQQAKLDWIPQNNRNGNYLHILENRESTAHDVAVALYGLAVNHQPVLNDILSALNHPDGFSYVDQLYLLAGLAAIGDEKNALNFYEQLVCEKLENQGTHTFVKAGKTKEDFLEATAIASLSASVLHTKEADSFIQYLMDTPSETELYLMEMLVYLQNYQAKQLEPAVFHLSTAKENQTITLKPLEIQTLTLYEADWKALQVSVEQGKLLATAKVLTNRHPDQAKEEFDLDRKIEVIGGGDLEVGKKVKITLTPRVPQATDTLTLTLEDYLPAGFRYMGMGDMSEQKWKWMEGRREGQSILFYYFNDVFGDEEELNQSGEAAPESLVYYAICVAPGSYTQLPARLTESHGKRWGQSEKEQVEIR